MAASKRKIRLQSQAKDVIKQGFDNFSDGSLALLNVDPRTDSKTRVYIQNAFAASYSLFEWCRTIKYTGKARFFLAEVRSALPLALALAARGLYEAANMQLRYVCECIISFLYFRDHPRELELALNDADQWDLTRPKSVCKFIRKLPEYSNEVGLDLLSLIEDTYSKLCGYAHPRKPARMGQRAYLTQAAVDPEHARLFQERVELLCRASAGIFWLGCRDDHAAASELTQVLLTKPIKAAQKRKIEAQVKRDINN